MSLTSKQEKFIQGVVSGLSQTDAYKQAYDTSNLKDNTIWKKASELMADSKVKGRYEELIQEYKNQAKWNRSLAEEKLLWLLEKSQESIENMGLKQANSNSMLNTIKELNTLTDLYPKKTKEDNNLEDREAEKIANAILELRGRNGTR